MPIDYKKNYPSDWKAISKRLRSERAGNVCECAGACGVDHGGRCRAVNGGFRVIEKATRKHKLFDNEDAACNFLMMFDEHDYSSSKIVLTVAHLCRCKPKCGNENHLLVMCQACHLLLDMPLHKANRAKTHRKLKHKNQEEMEFDKGKPFEP